MKKKISPAFASSGLIIEVSSSSNTISKAENFNDILLLCTMAGVYTNNEV